jgi:hypothetical protein
MKPLSKARLRKMATARELAVDEGELTRLLPMVRDLLDVARRLRTTLREPPATQPE